MPGGTAPSDSHSLSSCQPTHPGTAKHGPRAVGDRPHSLLRAPAPLTSSDHFNKAISKLGAVRTHAVHTNRGVEIDTGGQPPPCSASSPSARPGTTDAAGREIISACACVCALFILCCCCVRVCFLYPLLLCACVCSLFILCCVRVCSLYPLLLCACVFFVYPLLLCACVCSLSFVVVCGGAGGSVLPCHLVFVCSAAGQGLSRVYQEQRAQPRPRCGW